MKVRVDAAKCSGHGRCYDLAPEVFAEGEQSHCLIPDENVPVELEAKARLAQANCPEEALEIEES